MVLVALAMVAIIAMAALSIDIITLYLAREEAQRSADAAALAAARVISLSGLTGDPNDSVTPSLWHLVCGGSSSAATQAATAVATQSAVGNAAATVTVTYSTSAQSSSDCGTFSPGGAFSANPMVTVQLNRASLPTFFSRIWGNTGNSVSATAAAEVFNPSFSATVGNNPTGIIIPVQPSCVKPWIVPNQDPLNPSGCSTTSGTKCNPFVNRATGNIVHPGISLNGSSTTGVIGENFWLIVDCHFAGGACTPRSNPATANLLKRPTTEFPPGLEYLPGQTLYSSVAVPACSAGSSNYESAIAGCDQSTAYQCGVQGSSSATPNMIDLSENPANSGDTTNGVMCLTNQGDAGTITRADGQDTLNPYEQPSSYPFQILAGTSNPLVGTGLSGGSPITSSPSIVSLPIYDDGLNQDLVISSTGTTPITIVGFLQVFINAVDPWGNVNVTVLNVAGCGNGSGNPPAVPVFGSSPVPIRLITPQ